MIVLDLLPDLIYSDATYKIIWNIVITMLDSLTKTFIKAKFLHSKSLPLLFLFQLQFLMYGFVLLLTFRLINVLNHRSEIHLTALLHPAYLQDHVSIINFNDLLFSFPNLRDLSTLLSQFTVTNFLFFPLQYDNKRRQYVFSIANPKFVWLAIVIFCHNYFHFLFFTMIQRRKIMFSFCVLCANFDIVLECYLIYRSYFLVYLIPHLESSLVLIFV